MLESSPAGSSQARLALDYDDVTKEIPRLKLMIQSAKSFNAHGLVR